LIRVALTGNAASGKSFVTEIWGAAGVPVFGADDLARSLTAPGGEAIPEIVAAFGPECLTETGALHRAAMRSRILHDAEARRTLEGILHPRIAEAERRWAALQEAGGTPLVVSEIPLLFEVGRDGEFDWVVFVDAPAELREDRLVRERGLSREEARALMALQGDPLPKRERADVVLDNAGSTAELRGRALALLEEIRARHGVSSPLPSRSEEG